jgi:hypothetical protein
MDLAISVIMAMSKKDLGKQKKKNEEKKSAAAAKAAPKGKKK